MEASTMSSQAHQPHIIMDTINSFWTRTLSGEEFQMHQMRWSRSRTSKSPHARRLREISPPHREDEIRIQRIQIREVCLKFLPHGRHVRLHKLLHVSMSCFFIMKRHVYVFKHVEGSFLDFAVPPAFTKLMTMVNRP